MFGTSGIRGPVGETVTADLALSVGRALGADTERVVVGRDPRESGALLTDALAAGLRESGTDVLDLGLAATPTVARAVAWADADAGVSITASHNPPEDNGIKLWQASGQAFDAERRGTISQRVREDAADLRDWDSLGNRQDADARERHVRELVAAVDIDAPPSVIVDVGNGAGGVTVDALQELGCTVETLNAQPDGSFPGRPSEPTAENCQSLATLVAETDADLGIAHDGDADRMRAVAGDGTYLSGDVTLALFARAAAEAGQRIAAPVDTSLAVADHLAEIDVAVERTKVGDVYVAERVAADGVAFGGEPSGAWIWPDATLCPDGPLAACRLVELAAERPLAERAAEIDTYPIHRDSVAVEDKTAVMDRVRELVADRYDAVETMDGVRVDLGDGWFLLRASGTQPLVRITAEAREAGRAESIFADARDLLETARS
ncbi:phosphoglucosamine mutase [Halorientalis regularis]|jgi:phosphoglucosamine mutase|uniref:Phosphoglucosamine mutase n=1 Tax=Halorientalis regularis TaxID=660518 RepID=A0A1G7GYJ1_9EURY|nr:phosphoglucosamine mutase [Halorientalis regularis]SDE93134.1 phosphoglucosamine mutase [Halorientalis regularis]